MPHPPLGPVRCPACGKQALPLQTRCLHCNSRLSEVLPVETPAGCDVLPIVTPASHDEFPVVMPVSDAIQAGPLVPLPRADGKCPGCGKDLPAEAVLCIECGYDTRTGRKRQTVHAVADEESEADAFRRKWKRSRGRLPAELGKVQMGLGFHYARLVLTLLFILVLLGLLGYGATVRPRPDDWGLLLSGLAAVVIRLLAAVFGVVGSVLCLWVGRPSRAWGFIFASLLLDGLTLPLSVFLHLAALPPLLGAVVEFVSWLLFMLFLRRLALYIDRPDEANEAMALIIRGIVLLVGVPLLLVLLAQVAFLCATIGNVTAVQLILMGSVGIVVVELVFVIKLFFSILGNLQTLRASIASQLPRPGREKDERAAFRPGS